MTESLRKGSAVREPLRVFIAAENQAECDRIAQRLIRALDMKVAGSATSAAELEAAMRCDAKLDVLITDVMLGSDDMAPVLTRIKHLRDDLDILIYTAFSQDPFVIRAILAGATGYILKGDQEDLVTSVRLLKGGGSPVSPTVARSVLRAIHSRTFAPQPPQPQKHEAPENLLLSQRETEILTLLAKGISFSEIADILSISHHTVTAHIKKIYRKLQVHSRGEAVYEASCMGLLSDRIGS